MTDAVIRVEGIGKRYHIGERARQGALLRDVIANAFRPNGKNGGKRSSREMIWAVRDVSFEVKQGEVVGLIGRNGAGKSTLLKLLARITRPTVGHAELHGRIASLLEVGTGFHPELTGRENIFLSGAILGMSKAEIVRKFDEIVAFSEVERFIDTPLKHYSSGMGMRLAFAVAAHLEPEILLVDEVLSVGDASFQKKCLGKIEEVSRGGRTILFVSHNMGAVNTLCARCILLDKGQIVIDGATPKVAATYHAQSMETVGRGSDLRAARRIGTGKAIFSSMTIQPMDPDGTPLEAVYSGCDLEIDLTIEARQNLVDSNVAVIIYDTGGYRLIDVNTSQKGKFLRLNKGETARVCFRIQQLLLRPGTYLMTLWIGRERMEEIDYIDGAATLEVAANVSDNKGSITFPGTYTCRFEESISILQPLTSESALRDPIAEKARAQ